LAELVRKATQSDDDFLPTALRLAAVAADHQARDIKGYDVRGLTLIADAFIICSARSEPQMKAIQQAVLEEMKGINVRPLSTEGGTESGWVVMDYGDVILHLFREEARAFYDLDGLWADAPEIDLDLD
jgi:ribosome-associated protein